MHDGGETDTGALGGGDAKTDAGGIPGLDGDGDTDGLAEAGGDAAGAPGAMDCRGPQAHRAATDATAMRKVSALFTAVIPALRNGRTPPEVTSREVGLNGLVTFW